jgi:hypothetical protein
LSTVRARQGGQSVITVQDPIDFVAEYALLKMDWLSLSGKPKAWARSLKARAFHFEHAIDAVAILIDPSADRVARIGRCGSRSVGQSRPSV